MGEGPVQMKTSRLPIGATWVRRKNVCNLLPPGNVCVNCQMLKLNRTNQLGWFKSVLAGLLVVLVLVSSLLAVSPELHHRLHADSTQSDHQCALTILEHQQVLASEPQTLVPDCSLGLISFLRISHSAALPSFDYASAPSRAPPAVLA